MTQVPDDANQAPIGPEPGPGVRASDADRAATVSVLEDAVSRGLLTAEEGGERMAAALSARFRNELPSFTADLPAAAPVVPSAAGWRQVGSSLATQVRYDLSGSVSAGLRSRRFLVTALVALLLLGVLVALGSLAVHGLLDGGEQHHRFGFERT